MASPHVAGAMALFLQAGLSTNALIGAATPNVVRNAGTGSPNRLLYAVPGGSTTPTPITSTPVTRTPTPMVTPIITPTPGTGTEWRAYTYYAAGTVVTYQGVRYRCIQSHTAYPGWEPPNVPALWQRVL